MALPFWAMTTCRIAFTVPWIAKLNLVERDNSLRDMGLWCQEDEFAERASKLLRCGIVAAELCHCQVNTQAIHDDGSLAASHNFDALATPSQKGFSYDLANSCLK